MSTLGEHLPAEQRAALRSAIRWEVFTIGYTIVTIVLVALVLGGSQAMRTAWIEDMLSLIPQVSFLVALLFVRRGRSRRFPFGLHRMMGVGHLLAGVALLVVGTILAVEAVTGLVSRDRPTIGTVRILGETVWLGWIMIGVMAVIVVGPLIYGRAKLRLAPKLHNKVLYADADMAKADWTTNAASIVGVLGIGLGIWWLDSAAALFISLGIVRDGLSNTSNALRDLVDQRARSFDDEVMHPLVVEVLLVARRPRWVRHAGLRMRDLGQVFHVEVFVVPRRWRRPTVRRLRRLTASIEGIDWKLLDVVVVPVDRLPDAIER